MIIHFKDIIMIQRNFGKIMALLVVLILVPIVIVTVKKIKRWAGEVKCDMSKN